LQRRHSRTRRCRSLDLPLRRLARTMPRGRLRARRRPILRRAISASRASWTTPQRRCRRPPRRSACSRAKRSGRQWSTPVSGPPRSSQASRWWRRPRIWRPPLQRRRSRPLRRRQPTPSPGRPPRWCRTLPRSLRIWRQRPLRQPRSRENICTVPTPSAPPDRRRSPHRPRPHRARPPRPSRRVIAGPGSNRPAKARLRRRSWSARCPP